MPINLIGFLTSKLGAGILIGVLAVTHGLAFYSGDKWASRGFEKAVASALDKQAKKYSKALDRAVEDQAKIDTTERSSNDTTKEFEALGDRSYCPPTPSELRLMEAIADRTKRK